MVKKVTLKYTYYNISDKSLSEIGISYGSIVNVSISTYIYGDKDYSTYFELNRNLNVLKYPVKLFIGGTPKNCSYGSGFGITNVGFNVSGDSNITKYCHIPISLTFCGNPQTKKIFFIFIIKI